MVVIRSIRKTSYRVRARGRCAKQTLEQKEHRETAQVYITLSKVLPGISVRARFALFWTGIAYTMLYSYSRHILWRNKRWQGRPPPTFGALDKDWCHHFLRFQKEHLWRLSEALLLPAEHRLDNGSWTDNQEMLIVLLLRLGSCDTWMKLEDIIHIEFSHMSRVFKVSMKLLLYYAAA